MQLPAFPAGSRQPASPARNTAASGQWCTCVRRSRYVYVQAWKWKRKSMWPCVRYVFTQGSEFQRAIRWLRSPFNAFSKPAKRCFAEADRTFWLRETWPGCANAATFPAAAPGGNLSFANKAHHRPIGRWTWFHHRNIDRCVSNGRSHLAWAWPAYVGGLHRSTFCVRPTSQVQLLCASLSVAW